MGKRQDDRFATNAPRLVAEPVPAFLALIRDRLFCSVMRDRNHRNEAGITNRRREFEFSDDRINKHSRSQTHARLVSRLGNALAWGDVPLFVNRNQIAVSHL
jgi:hypothetical protein